MQASTEAQVQHAYAPLQGQNLAASTHALPRGLRSWRLPSEFLSYSSSLHDRPHNSPYIQPSPREDLKITIRILIRLAGSTGSFGIGHQFYLHLPSGPWPTVPTALPGQPCLDSPAWTPFGAIRATGAISGTAGCQGSCAFKDFRRTASRRVCALKAKNGDELPSPQQATSPVNPRNHKEEDEDEEKELSPS